MTTTYLLFLLSAGAIYFACEFFVNAVEWCGKRLNLGATAVGTILAAIGTAMPESAVTLSAVAFGRDPSERDIGVGAAMGGPLVLSTIAYGIVGLVLLGYQKRLGRADAAVLVDHSRLARDQASFLLAFVCKVGLGLAAFAYKPWTAALLLAFYGLYVWQELRTTEAAADEDSLEPLKFRPNQAHPSLAWATFQLTVMLVIIGAASHVFVGQLQAIGNAWQLPPHVVALLLSPVATELPEIMNACIWVRQGKEQLALANISGAMMIQATIPSALGLYFTPWLFDHTLIAAGATTAVAMVYMWVRFSRRQLYASQLLWGFAAYGAFAVYLICCGGH